MITLLIMEDIIEKIKNKVGLNCVFDFICSMTASNIWNINWVNNLENWKNVDKLLKKYNRLRTIQIYKQKNYNQYMSRTSYYLISDIETLSLKKHGSEKHHLIMQNLNLRKQKIKDKFDKQNMRIKEYIDYVYSNDFPLLNDIINNEMLIHNKNLIIGTGKFFPVRDINTIKNKKK